jgi:cell filamentation protein, protein adenylyltransferase
MYDAVADDYCYPGTTVLKNKLDLTDADELAAFEAEVSAARSDEEAPAGDLDYAHFKAIHRHLFQDVYDWAREARTVRISKDNSMFCYPENIESEATKLFARLRADKFLQGLSSKDFAKQAASSRTDPGQPPRSHGRRLDGCKPEGPMVCRGVSLADIERSTKALTTFLE